MQEIENLNEPVHAAEQAAKLVGTNRQYISDAKKVAAKSPEMLEQVRQGNVNLPTAVQHIAAVTSYPELAAPGIPQKDAITIAKSLDELSEDERDAARSRIMAGDTNTKAILAGRAPLPPPPHPITAPRSHRRTTERHAGEEQPADRGRVEG